MATTWQDLYQAFKKGEIAPDVEIDFGGRKVPAGEFFGEAEKTYQSLTTWSQRNAERERALLQREQELDQKARELEERSAPASAPAPDATAPDWIPEELRYAASVDPYWKAMTSFLSGFVSEQQQRWNQAYQWARASSQAALRKQYEATLDTLAAQDKDLASDEGKARLIQFALERKIPDLTTAYALFTRDRDLERSRKEAYEKGLEEGKKAGAVPFVPPGMRRPVISPQAPPPAKDVHELRNRIEQDPDVMQAFVRDLEGGPQE